ncbi:hypothetical protein OH779_05605 [Actinacidiphila glaucinigra]|uniref:hypothetical protein n=1 Tax=Actinacidiphila glaucinigra TaxID=235986 RepID=UPI00386ED4B3
MTSSADQRPSGRAAIVTGATAVVPLEGTDRGVIERLFALAVTAPSLRPCGPSAAAGGLGFRRRRLQQLGSPADDGYHAAAKSAMGRLAGPWDVEELVPRVAEPVRTLMTGQVVTVDGGLELF